MVHCHREWSLVIAGFQWEETSLGWWNGWMEYRVQDPSSQSQAYLLPVLPLHFVPPLFSWSICFRAFISAHEPRHTPHMDFHSLYSPSRSTWPPDKGSLPHHLPKGWNGSPESMRYELGRQCPDVYNFLHVQSLAAASVIPQLVHDWLSRWNSSRIHPLSRLGTSLSSSASAMLPSARPPPSSGIKCFPSAVAFNPHKRETKCRTISLFKHNLSISERVVQATVHFFPFDLHIHKRMLRTGEKQCRLKWKPLYNTWSLCS